jgi:hypothetical protein
MSAFGDILLLEKVFLFSFIMLALHSANLKIKQDKTPRSRDKPR